MVWLPPLLATLLLMVASVTIATVVGIPTAWALGTLRHSGGKLSGWIGDAAIFMLGAVMLVPLVLHAAAWEATAGKFGINLLTQTGSRPSGTQYGLFGGLLATAWIHGVSGTAIVALATLFGIGKVPATIHDLARLDVGPIKHWWTIQLRLATPWIALGAMAVAGLAATEMTVADLYGYRTLIDQFYLRYALAPSATSLAWACIIPAVAAAVIIAHWLCFLKGRYPASVQPTNANQDRQGATALLVSGCIAVFATLLTTAIPIAGLIRNLGQTVSRTDSGQLNATWSLTAAVRRVAQAPQVFASEYTWTAIITVATGVLAVAVAWPLVSLSVNRSHQARSGLFGAIAVQSVLDGVTIAMLCMPGPVVGLAVVWLFQSDLPGFSFLYQQTIVPTVIAMMVRGLPISYWIIRGGYTGIPYETLQMSALDTGPVERFWCVEQPLVRRSLMGAGLATAIVTSGDLPATLPVAPPGVNTVAVRLFGLLHSGGRYQESALVVWYMLAVIVTYWVFRLVYNRFRGLTQS